MISTQEDSVGAHTHPTHVEQDDIEDIEDDLETLEDRIDTERLNNIEMAKLITALQEENDDQQRAIAVLEARGDVITQPTTPTPVVNTIDLNLTVTDNKLNYKPLGYPRNVVVLLINGESDFIKKSFLITIKSPDGSFVKDAFKNTLGDGDISEAWVPTGVVTPGTYTVTISINSQTDSIQFIIL